MSRSVLHKQIEEEQIVVRHLFQSLVSECGFAVLFPGRQQRLVGMTAGAKRKPKSVLLPVEVARRSHPDFARYIATHSVDAKLLLLLFIFADEFLAARLFHQ